MSLCMDQCMVYKIQYKRRILKIGQAVRGHFVQRRKLRQNHNFNLNLESRSLIASSEKDSHMDAMNGMKLAQNYLNCQFLQLLSQIVQQKHSGIMSSLKHISFLESYNFNSFFCQCRIVTPSDLVEELAKWHKGKKFDEY